MAARREDEGPDPGGARPPSSPSPSSSSRRFAWEEIGRRTGQGAASAERWLAVGGKVYDVSRFHARHPGGSLVIRHYAGQDATDAFTAFHKDQDLVNKYLSSLLIGELAPDQPSCEPTKNAMLINDFRQLHSTVKKTGLFKTSYSFFTLMFLHAFLLDAAAWLIIWYSGKSWVPFLISAAVFATAQIQYAFFVHDLGHVSVFQKPWWNRQCFLLFMGVFRGGTASWWNHMHNQHHAKTNCFRKDPDLNMHPLLFSLGKTLSVELGKKKKKYMPYQYQHIYFTFLAPLTFTIYVQLIMIRFTILRKKWLELIFILTFHIRLCLMYVPLMGFSSFMAFLWLASLQQRVMWISPCSTTGSLGT